MWLPPGSRIGGLPAFKHTKEVSHGYGTGAEAANEVPGLQGIREEGRPHLSGMQRVWSTAVVFSLGAARA